ALPPPRRPRPAPRRVPRAPPPAPPPRRRPPATAPATPAAPPPQRAARGPPGRRPVQRRRALARPARHGPEGVSWDGPRRRVGQGEDAPGDDAVESVRHPTAPRKVTVAVRKSMKLAGRMPFRAGG